MQKPYSDLGFSILPTGHLALHGLDLTTLITEAPVYVMNEPLIRTHIRAYIDGLKKHYPKKAEVFYASKAFLNLAMARLVAQEGIGLDVCSEGELSITEKAYFDRNLIIFHGNNKSNSELEKAIFNPIRSIIVDSPVEFSRIETIAQEAGFKPGVMLRVNPHINVDTHPSMATGVKGSKFGLPIENPHTVELIQKMSTSPFAAFQGLHCHIGSQVLDFNAYTDALNQLVSFIALLKKDNIAVNYLNIGGGLGVDQTIPSQHLIGKWVEHVSQALVTLCAKESLDLPELMIEPGRSIISESGCTLYRIGTIKETDEVTIVAVQGGMSDNIRPALLGAHYDAVVANRISAPPLTKPLKVVGSCCESGDILIPNIHLPSCKEGDVLALFNTGAYSLSLASQYNKHLLPGVVFVRDGGEYDWVTHPQPLDQLVQNDTIPLHLR